MTDLDHQIEALKQKITDYINISKMFDFPEKEREVQINLMLEDLKKLMDKRDKER
ncbi:hypothetical protein SDC9_70227 [bioreactor metagenome]|uniref:Uncharacterized protein n=1 Tax=bioreactor metagenome TaxID=1076179 RepID=A0A644YB23_9ZZZZ|nr:hypothetical protein [Petrimonas sp.]MEA5046507.1 hypothetical protein [Petrimonas sp.]